MLPHPASVGIGSPTCAPLSPLRATSSERLGRFAREAFAGQQCCAPARPGQNARLPVANLADGCPGAAKVPASGIAAVSLTLRANTNLKRRLRLGGATGPVPRGTHGTLVPRHLIIRQRYRPRFRPGIADSSNPGTAFSGSRAATRDEGSAVISIAFRVGATSPRVENPDLIDRTSSKARCRARLPAYARPRIAIPLPGLACQSLRLRRLSHRPPTEDDERIRERSCVARQ